MSLLSQFRVVQVESIRTVSTRLTHKMRESTYDRWKDEFERPHNALGNRYRNPIRRFSDRVIQIFLAPFRAIGRIEISVRMRPY